MLPLKFPFPAPEELPLDDIIPRADVRPRRRIEPFARIKAVRLVLGRVRLMVPDIVPDSEDRFVRMLCDARLSQMDRLPTQQPTVRLRWPAVDLNRLWTALSTALERERVRSITPDVFVVRYVPILLMPPDVATALEQGRVDVDEAAVLARLTDLRTHLSVKEVIELREREMRLLEKIDLPLDEFARRIDTVLRNARAERHLRTGNHTLMTLQFEPTPTFGSKHLFWDQIELLKGALADIRYDEVTERDVVEALAAIDQVLDVLHRIRRRRHQRQGP